jgi:SAM-dependent methyltransferase
MRRSIIRRRRAGGDADDELRFWVENWDAHLRRGGALFAPDGLELLGEREVAPDYEGRRRQEARAQVLRILREAGIEDDAYFEGKVVLEIGPGAVGFPEVCGARVALAVEPLAPRLAEAGLLLDPGAAVYLPVGAEAIPLLDDSVDVVVARNSLDHVADPAAVCAEVARILRPGGTFILNVDIDHAPTATEPHAFTLDDVRALVARFDVEREVVSDVPHGHEGRLVVVVARKAVTEGG